MHNGVLSVTPELSPLADGTEHPGPQPTCTSCDVRQACRCLYMGALTNAVARLLDEAVANKIRGPDTEQLAEAIVSTWNGGLIAWAIFRRGPLDAWLGERLDTVIAPHLP